MRARWFIEGVPRGEPRQRTRAIPHPSVPGKWIGTTYPDHSADEWKQLVALQSARHRFNAPLGGPILVSLDVFIARPQRLCRPSDPDGPLWAPVKPDNDNLEKLVWDTLTRGGWWGDDAQVAWSETRKFYCGKNGKTGVLVTVETLDEVPDDVRRGYATACSRVRVEPDPLACDLAGELDPAGE